MRLSFKEMKDAIAKIPKDIQYDVDLEAGDISIVTPTPIFGGGDGLVGKIAKKIKRIVLSLRSIMKGEAETEEFIRNLIEDVAGIDSIYFDVFFKLPLSVTTGRPSAEGERMRKRSETNVAGLSNLSELHQFIPKLCTISEVIERHTQRKEGSF